MAATNAIHKPDVDMIVPVHSASRPIERAVSSVLLSQSSLRVTVVVHNIDPTSIRARLGSLADDPRVRVVDFEDGVASAAGPFNHGLSIASGRFTSVMGSDDELEAGAVDSWLNIAHRAQASVVIARQRHAGGPAVLTPVSRPWKQRHLDFVRDRLSYRSAPLGLVERERFSDLRFAEGLRTGEDIPYVLRLWCGNHEIAFDRNGPAYLVHDDADDRVTFSGAPVAEDLGHLSRILPDPWFLAQREVDREAFATKAIRVSIFGAAHARRTKSDWRTGDREALREWTVALLGAGGEPARALSVADHRLLAAILNLQRPTTDLIRYAAARRQFAQPASLISRRIFQTFAREAPIRFALASTALKYDFPKPLRKRKRGLKL